MATGHRITIAPAAVHVEVRVDGEKIADSDRAVVLHETGIAPRYYLPRADVRMDMLQPSPSTTRCPFKGQASYWSVATRDNRHEDLAWSYEQPIAGAEEIAGLVCFYNERVDLTVS